MGGIFGGSKQKSSQQSSSQSTSDSGNNYWPQAQQQFGGVANQTATAGNALQALLGLGGNKQASDDQYQRFLDSTGFQSQLQQGSQAITGNNATKGLLDSGATLKALTGYGQNMAKQSFSDYLGQLMGLGNQGLQAGSLLANAGQFSHSQSTSQSSGTSTSKSKPGIGGLVGGIMTA